MARIVQVSDSDYRIKVKDDGTGTITLDTGVDVGTVYITGDLVVQGETTTVNTTNLAIEDNTILLNKGEGGAGITEGTAGIEIDRGSLPNAQLLFDESVTHYDPYQSTDVNGTFVLKTDDGLLSGIQTNSITVRAGVSNTNLVFDMQNEGSILSIVNTTSYETRVLNDNDIPNKKYINDYVAAFGGVATVDRIYYPLAAPPGSEDSEVQASATQITFSISTVQRARITSTGLTVDNINTFGDSITNSTTNNFSLSGNRIVLTANNASAANRDVELNAFLVLDDQSSTPSPTGSKTKIWSPVAGAGAGRSGIYFTNNTTYGNSATSTDELVAKNRALLFSMLF